MSDITIDLASDKLLPLYEDDPAIRYYCYYGGRGGGKSVGIAQYLVIKAYSQVRKILCVREYQNSIKNSSFGMIKQAIYDLGLDPYFTIQETQIICNHTGSTFMFLGLQNMPSIKSLTGITDVFVEEAATISRDQWTVLVPTIREPGSKFYLAMNPVNEDDFMYQTFIESPESDTRTIKINWSDNKFFPEELNKERLKCLNNAVEDYDHIWEGGCRTISDAQVFKNRYRVEAFEETFDRSRAYYFGLDWGFLDPSAGVRCYIENNTLYITHELYASGLTLDQLPELLVKTLPDLKRWPIYCDQSRPDSILYLKQKGFNAIGAGKGAGSIEDGIEFMKSMKIVIHPRCVNTIREFNRYSYKVDRISGAILPILVDKDNHLIDAIRYSMWTSMKSTGVASFARLAEINRGITNPVTYYQ